MLELLSLDVMLYKVRGLHLTNERFNVHSLVVNERSDITSSPSLPRDCFSLPYPNGALQEARFG